MRKRRGGAINRWAQVAHWTAVALGLFNTALFAWFFLALLGFADTFIFPLATMTLLTWLWTINLPAVLALLIFTGLAWKNHDWQPAWRLHYTLVTMAGLAFVWFLANWNLLALV